MIFIETQIPAAIRFIVCLGMTVTFFSCSPRKAVRSGDKHSSSFDPDAFSRTCALAEEFTLDDRLAWCTTDSIMTEKPMLLDSLDETWFIDKRGTARFAFYGRYFSGSNDYRVKYVFKSDTAGTVVRLPNTADPHAVRFARAVSSAYAVFRHLVDSMQVNVDYNHYIRVNVDGSFSVWFFPAGYGTYCAHGLDFHLSIDPSGSAVTGREVVGTYLRYFEIDQREQTVELDNTYAATPSLGNVFFVLMNRDRFNRVVILNSHSTSAMVYSKEKAAWEWVHGGRE